MNFSKRLLYPMLCCFILQLNQPLIASAGRNGSGGFQPDFKNMSWGDLGYYGFALGIVSSIGWCIKTAFVEGTTRAIKKATSTPSPEEKEDKIKAEAREFQLKASLNESIDALERKDRILSQWCKDGTVDTQECLRLKRELVRLMRDDNKLRLQHIKNDEKLLTNHGSQSIAAQLQRADSPKDARLKLSEIAKAG